MITIATLASVLVVQTLAGSPDRVQLEQSVAERRHAAREMERSAAAADEQLIPKIVDAFADSDADVRLAGANALGTLTLRFMPGSDATPPAFSLRNRPALAAAVAKAISDDDPRVRGAALRTLRFVINPADITVSHALVTRYDQESDESVRAVLVFELNGRAEQSADIRDTIIRALKDTSPRVQRQAALGVARLQSQEALPVIVAELRSGEGRTRAAFVQALVGYGALAKPHVQVLKDLLTAVDLSKEERHQIINAINTIER